MRFEMLLPEGDSPVVRAVILTFHCKLCEAGEGKWQLGGRVHLRNSGGGVCCVHEGEVKLR